MKSTSSLAVGLTAVAGLAQATMIPDSVLGFSLPSDPKLASRSAAWQRRTMIPNSELHFTLPQAGAQVASRDAPWQPAVGASWQIVLSNSIELGNSAAVAPSNVGIFDIDLFDNTAQGTDGSRIAALHSQGKKVICYFSAGTYEPGRPDSNKFKSADLGKELPDWPGEKWLKLSSANVRSIMSNRIAMAAKMGCDAVDPDNMDAYVSLPSCPARPHASCSNKNSP
jgi:endo-alpha-1,4-polygalactosaminidase (GH114 family)